jgi:hypothetical protein
MLYRLFRHVLYMYAYGLSSSSLTTYSVTLACPKTIPALTNSRGAIEAFGQHDIIRMI